MHIQDVQPLIPFGNYQIDIPLHHLAGSIQRYIDDYGLQLNPVFQRGHVWTADQQTSFMEFILRGGKTTPILLNHENWSKNVDGQFVCVDGLQRITTLLEFMQGNVSVFDGHTIDQIEGITAFLRTVYIKIYVNQIPANQVIEWYLQLNSGGTPHTEGELNRVRLLMEIK